MKIDFVLPYVNCNKKEWQLAYKNECRKFDLSTEIRQIRYREWDNLKYIFRGIEKFMPFIKKVLLIVSDETQVPDWLDTNRVNIVLHKDFIPKEFLPTFNSCTIEMFLGNIPGLSENFIYSNDDIFLLNSFKESDFFDEKGLPKIRTRRSSGIDTMFKKVQFLEQKKVAEIFDKKVEQNNWIKLDHCLSPFCKSTLKKVEKELGEEIYNSCSKFRDKKNFNQYLYTYYDYFSNNYSNSNRVYDYVDFTISNDVVELSKKISKRIESQEVQAICINDNVEFKSEVFENVKSIINSSLNKILPTSCNYEKKTFTIAEIEKTKEKKIDFVFPYVDNADPIWQEQHRKWAPKTSMTTYEKWATDACRFRSNDLLKYVFRGIDKNLPWINNVYMLVSTQSQVPSWVNKKNVKIITHDKFIPQMLLPTFNSSTIEMFLGNIPGLSEKFLYGNDDMFVTSPLKISDFFEEDVLKYHITEGKFRKDFIGDILRKEDRKLILNVDDGVVERINHIITPYLKSTIKNVYKKYNVKILNSCTRFREEKNYNQWIFSLYQAHFKEFKDYKLRYLVKEILRRNLPKWDNNWRKYDIVCLNDAEGTTDRELNIVKHKFENLFPEKSKYEI